MRRLCLVLSLIGAAALPMQAFAADAMTTSVNAHMRALAWLTGTYQCAQRTTYSNGKVRNDNGTITFSPVQDGWMTSTFKGSTGAQYYGYDPKKNRYVTLGISGPGNYGAGYVQVTGNTVTFVLPDALDSDPYTPGDSGSFRQTANGYKGKQSGPSDRYPGLRFTSTFSCVRK